MFDHVIEQHDVERLIGQLCGFKYGVLDLETQLFTRIAAALVKRLDAQHVPAVLAEDVEQVTQAAAHLQQLAALGVEPIQKRPRVVVIPDLEPLLEDSGVVLAQGIELGIILGDLDVIGLLGPRAGVHQAAPVAADDLVELGHARGENHRRIIDSTVVARHRSRHSPGSRGILDSGRANRLRCILPA